jgi:hypothetical protein
LSTALVSGLVALCAALTPASGALAATLPGTAELPLVEGSEVVACPQWDNITFDSVCVSVPQDTRGAIIDAYQRALQERGFSLREGAHQTGLFLKRSGEICETVTVEPLYVTAGSVVVFEFEHHREPADQCLQ